MYMYVYLLGWFPLLIGIGCKDGPRLNFVYAHNLVAVYIQLVGDIIIHRMFVFLFVEHHV